MPPILKGNAPDAFSATPPSRCHPTPTFPCPRWAPGVARIYFGLDRARPARQTGSPGSQGELRAPLLRKEEGVGQEASLRQSWQNEIFMGQVFFPSRIQWLFQVKILKLARTKVIVSIHCFLRRRQACFSELLNPLSDHRSEAMPPLQGRPYSRDAHRGCRAPAHFAEPGRGRGGRPQVLQMSWAELGCQRALWPLRVLLLI